MNAPDFALRERIRDAAHYERALYPAPSAAERTLEVLTDDPDECFIAAEVGEYDGEREALGLLLSVLADHKENKTGREADILRLCDRLIGLIFKNRGADYWSKVDQEKVRRESARAANLSETVKRQQEAREKSN